jgi:phosphoribosylanthranilate isomerase
MSGPMTLIKICGITSLEDARVCTEAGADMLGFNFYPASPRYIPPRDARRIIELLPAAVTCVGVFVNEDSPARVAQLALEAGVSVAQLHGDESPSYCRALRGCSVVKALRVSPAYRPEQAAGCGSQTVLLDAFSPDAYGGTGRTFAWPVARATRALVSGLILAGGLTPENVAEAIVQVRPYAVDACSSLESAPGIKDGARVLEFVAAVKRADAVEADVFVVTEE